jgi:hypothetical protein
MRLNRDWADPRSASPVGDRESLVQVEMRDIRPKVAGPCDTYEGVEVGSIDVDLAPMLMDDFAQLADVLFEHPMS